MWNATYGTLLREPNWQGPLVDHRENPPGGTSKAETPLRDRHRRKKRWTPSGKPVWEPPWGTPVESPPLWDTSGETRLGGTPTGEPVGCKPWATPFGDSNLETPMGSILEGPALVDIPWGISIGGPPLAVTIGGPPWWTPLAAYTRGVTPPETHIVEPKFRTKLQGCPLGDNKSLTTLGGPHLSDHNYVISLGP